MATTQDLNEIRYVVELTHDTDSGNVGEDTHYLVQHWPAPELSDLVKDENSVICVFDSIYYSEDVTHAKVYRSITDAQKDTRWMLETRSQWKAHVMPVNAKIFFVAGLGKKHKYA